MSLRKRLEKLRARLPEFACQAFLIEEPTQLFYLTGLSLSSGILLLHEKGEILFVDGRYIEMCQAQAPCPVLLNQGSTLSLWLSAEENQKIEVIGFDAEHTSYRQLEEWKVKLDAICKKALAIDDPVKSLRMIKDHEEQHLLRKAAKLGSEGFDHLCVTLKLGMTEREAALSLEIFWKTQGAMGLAFEPIIAFGPHSSMPHHRAGHFPLQEGMPILIDIGVNLDHYHSDMTRVLFSSPPAEPMKQIYEVVREAQQRAIDLCRPGIALRELDEAARKVISHYGYGEYFTHNLGHGVGLEIHEAPWIRGSGPHGEKLLEAGMLLTIEPGIYLPHIGGVRLEDTLLITPAGHENLTQRPTELRLL